MTRKKYFFPALLVGLFILLVLMTIPKGYFYGSYTDWLSQHIRLAETIRSACIEQKSIVPSFLPLGSGSNGYQFSYYGYLRPDILIGCLFPSIPMVYFVIGYILTGYLISVLLSYYWLSTYKIEKSTAFLGSLLFLTAACFFHMHRQIMFVNYMPFLILALLAVRKKSFRHLPLCLSLIYVNSFYYSISCLTAIGWYWLMEDGKEFWKNGFIRYLKATFLSIGIAAVLLIPTGLVILEHHRASENLSLPQMCGISLNLQSILYSPYGMGLTAICLYTLLLGLTCKKFRVNSIFLLVISTWCMAAWLLNGTLYARSKILIPFVPLIILHCTRILSALHQNNTREPTSRTDIKPNSLSDSKSDVTWKMWPCVIIAAVLPLWIFDKNFKWIAADIIILTIVVILLKLKSDRGPYQTRFLFSQVLLCLIPCMLFLQTMQKETFVEKSDVLTQQTELTTYLSRDITSLYRYESLVDVLNTANLATNGELQKSGMYSSITNKEYSDFYYNTLMSPIQINNSLAILPSENPFLLHFLGIRYLETTEDNIPFGYQPISGKSTIELDSGSDTEIDVGVDTKHKTQSAASSAKTLITENKHVLPIAYVTNSTMSETQFLKLDKYKKLDAVMRYTIVPDDSTIESADAVRSTHMTEYTPAFGKATIPDSLKITKATDGYLVNAKEETTVTLNLTQPLKDQILLLEFDIQNKGKHAVVIDINNMRNKLSGNSAPYPNGNDIFRYQFSDSSGNGLSQLKITFSKGKYLVTNIAWHTYSQKLLSQKQYTSVQSRTTTGNELLSCTANSATDGYFVTSIPLQKGMEILIDGKNVPILKLNQTFAGAKLEKGKHDIQVAFHAPGKNIGYLISILSFCIYMFCTARVVFTQILFEKGH